MHKITIMTKPNCSLCDAAVRVVQRVVGQRVVAIIEEIDITSDLELLEKYRDDVPVILIDGVERFRHTVDVNRLVKYFMDDAGESLVGIS